MKKEAIIAKWKDPSTRFRFGERLRMLKKSSFATEALQLLEYVDLIGESHNALQDERDLWKWAHDNEADVSDKPMNCQYTAMIKGVFSTAFGETQIDALRNLKQEVNKKK